MAGQRGELVQEVCKVLARIGAIKFGIFKLTSGKTSPYYVDLRLVPSFPDAFRLITDAYATMIEDELGLGAFDRIAGVPTSGIPFAAVVAFRLKKPFLYVRKEIKLHGRERRVEGILAPGDKVILLDDLVTTGKTLANAAEAIRKEGLDVLYIVGGAAVTPEWAEEIGALYAADAGSAVKLLTEKLSKRGD